MEYPKKDLLACSKKLDIPTFRRIRSARESPVLPQESSTFYQNISYDVNPPKQPRRHGENSRDCIARKGEQLDRKFLWRYGEKETMNI